MRKLSTIIALAAAFSTNAFAVTYDTSNSQQVDASLDVVAPALQTVSWAKVPTVNAGLHTGGSKVGAMSISGLSGSDGWAIYNGNAQYANGYVTYTFNNANGHFFRARVHDGKYPGVLYKQSGSGITTPVTLIPASYTSVDLDLDADAELQAGTYSTTFSVTTYNN
ncbi:TPA: CD15/CS22/SEF14 family fimbrial major subunit [Escherichia coli]|uniref:CD15/CS22/SEF14 family fimbrial major subunit n=2 Tax=Escherichia coli TaxID=562 RepID=UPI0002CA6806|nr:CD15/CS22/SEF14 family fimbrial major subunit [Escherichia coli]EEV7162466.1 adhesin [Escherichia coli]EEW0750819.1 adhesin [Escherichia coli]EEZ4535802.1 adhesin [Escherichia coli]EEZ4956219.1 adhesin [Escherichia coli]EFB1332157.1 adhesin [Escherichia coli]